MSRCTACVLVFALALCATPSYAGVLAGDTSAYAGWHGNTTFDSGGTLVGSVDWAVYAPGTFPGAFTGYTPDPNNYVYTYQAFEDGTAPLSFFSVALVYEASHIGTFSGGGVSGDPATTATLIPLDSATWEFAGIAGPGGMSTGLVFESPGFPMDGAASVLDDGEAAGVVPVPTPIPEPTSLAVWSFGGLLGLAVFMWRRRTRRP